MANPKRYRGRLAFDPETGFHTDADGKKVVSEDEGKTWRYAGANDPSHIARYERHVVSVDTTANAPSPEPHHHEVQADDPHYGGVVSNPDVEAETVTSHTEAYK